MLQWQNQFVIGEVDGEFMGNVELNLDELQLDLKNPRFDGLANQREALQ